MMEKDRHNDPFRMLDNRPDEALRVIYGRYYRLLAGAIRLYTDNDEEIKDIIQQTLMVIWETRTAVSRKEKPYFWMIGIARNIAREKIREAQRRMELPLEPQHDRPGMDKADGKILFEEMEGHIMKALSPWPEKDRRLFIESRFEGASNAELMERYNLAEQTVKNKVSMVAKSVRQYFRNLLMLLI